jgi:MoaA/NifB/PqqE/SkfB family radical SAM enzyme
MQQKKAIIKLGYSCNNNCIFCHAKPKRKYSDLTFKQIIDKISLLHEIDIDTIIFSGGEPTIRKDIFMVLEYAKKQGFSIGLATNARMLSMPSFLNKLATNDFKYCYTTLLSYDEMLHNKITCSDSFKQTIQGIKNIIKKDIDLLVNIVIIKENLEELDKTVELLKSLKIKKIKLSLAEPIKGQDPSSLLNIEDAAEKVKAILKNSSCSVGWDGFPLCLMKGFETRNINLKTEGVTHISEVNENEFSPVDSGNKSKLSKCNLCSKTDECEGTYSLYLESQAPTLIKPYIDLTVK